MKKFFKISAIIISAGVAATLAGCSGCAGCSGAPKNTALTVSNWYTGTSYKGIQPSFITDNPEYADYAEKIVYDVNFDKTNAVNSTYSAEYTNGSFSTEFHAVYYDWSKSTDSYKSDEKELVYYYKAVFNVSVQYKIKAGGAQSEVFNDSVVNESYFRAAGKNLQPVYSKQVIKSTSPANYQATSLDNAYIKVDAEYENFYSPDCGEVTTIAKEGDKQETNSRGLDTNNSIFDNSSLYIAVRSMKLSESLSQSISLYSAAAGGISTYSISGTDAGLEAKERKAVSAELAAKSLYSPVTKDSDGNDIEDKGIDTVAVNVNYTGGSLQGTTQTIWFAAIQNSDNNTARATMLKLSIPLSYNLGTLNFTLKEVQSTLWNK